MDSTFAFINIAQVRSQVIEKAGIDSAMNILLGQYRAEYDKMQEAYNIKVRNYIHDNELLSDAVRLSRQTEITEAEQRIALYVKRYNEDIAARREILMLPIEENINAAIERVMEKYGITVLLDINSVVKISTQVRDITTEVLELLQEEKTE